MLECCALGSHDLTTLCKGGREDEDGPGVGPGVGCFLWAALEKATRTLEACTLGTQQFLIPFQRLEKSWPVQLQV